MNLFTQLQILPYKKEDKAALMQVFQANVPLYFHPLEVDLYERFLDRTTVQYFVLWYENEIVGAGGIYTENADTLGGLSWGFVHPKHHGKGFGKSLLLYRLNALKAIQSVEKIMVRTAQFTYGFFEKMGFQLQYIEKDYWAPGLDLYAMQYKALE